MKTDQERRILHEAAKRVLREEDALKKLLTDYQQSLIQELTKSDATEQELVEANRRYAVADEFMKRIVGYGRWSPKDRT